MQVRIFSIAILFISSGLLAGYIFVKVTTTTYAFFQKIEIASIFEKVKMRDINPIAFVKKIKIPEINISDIFATSLFSREVEFDKQEGSRTESPNTNEIKKPPFRELIITGNYYKMNELATLPRISAKSYLIADIESGQIIEEKNSDTKYPIASLSKIVTALVSIETLDQSTTTRVSSTAKSTYGSQGELIRGEKITIGDLNFPLLLESSNDAAEAIAEFGGRTKFIKKMNETVETIGATSTFFEDPSGLSQKNISTVRDLFQISKYIFDNEKQIWDMTRLKDYQNGKHHWYSNSKFRNDKNFLGGKNGYNDFAKHTLITIVDLPLDQNKGNKKIAIIVLQSDNTEKDTRSLILYLLKNVYFD